MTAAYTGRPADILAQSSLLLQAQEQPFDGDILARYLASVGLHFEPRQPIHRFGGGLANRNYRVVVDDRPAVLRRPPDGDLPPGAHDMAREHTILSRLSRALPIVPDSFHFCPDPSIIGVPFQLIEYRAGIVVRGADLAAVAQHSDASSQLSELLVDTLVKIHSVDAEAAGLGEFGRPVGFVERAIAGWTRRGRAVARSSAASALIEEISAWLGRQHFRPRRPTLLHCDFKLDNLIIDPRTLAIAAVVDWDMGTRGDPLFDLATMLSYWAEPGDPDGLRTLEQMPTLHAGFWTREQAALRYAALTGRDLDDLPAMRVLAMLKLGVVFLQLHRQWVNGAVTDPRYAQFAQRGEALLAFARSMVHDDCR